MLQPKMSYIVHGQAELLGHQKLVMQICTGHSEYNY